MRRAGISTSPPRMPHTLFKIFPDSEAEGLDYAARLDRVEQPLWVQANLEEMCELAVEPVVLPKLFVMSDWNDTAEFGSLSELMINAFQHHPEWSFVTMRQRYIVPGRPETK